MSGPKSFSVRVFDARLKEIFSLQSQINQIFKELQNYNVNDKELKISFDCHDFIKANEDEQYKQLKSFDLGHKGTVRQEKYDAINNKVEEKIKKLKRFLKKVDTEKNDFLDKRQDHVSYVSYNKYFENSHRSFEKFKTELTSYLEQNIKEEKPELFENSKNQIEKVNPTIKKADFKFGFRNKEQKSKQKVIEHIDEKENKASEVRNQIAKNLLVKSLSKKNKAAPAEAKKDDEEIKQLTEAIENKIDQIESDEQRRKFKSGLNKLHKSQVLKDIYFYKEFLDHINQSEKTQDFKRQIKDLLFEINTSEISERLLEKKNEILKYAVELLESETIKQYKLESFKTQYHFLKEENKALIEDEFVKQKETEFLKTQLINGLENMNYQVMDGMEVIDFEKQSDFLFKVPNQNNFINLRVGKDNSIAYNFLIEENKAQLSIDEKREKVIEMEHTCKSFREVLKDLEIMGLEIDQTKTSAADMDKLMQVPKKYQQKIEKAEKERDRAREKEVKKKYLDE